MDELMVEKILTAVEQIPPGRVAAYGDIGAIVGIGPRRVGTVMSHFGSAVAWWRVTNRDGDPGGGVLPRALQHWRAEGIDLKPNGLGCRIADYRADLEQVAADYQRAIARILDSAGDHE